MSNSNDLAFPVSDRTQTPNDTIQLGLTKREYMAAMIAQGLVAHNGTFGETGSPGLIAGRAVFVADALLAELAKPTVG